MARYGIYHSKLEFFQKSLEVVHPFDSFSVVDDLAKQNIYDILTNGHIAI